MITFSFASFISAFTTFIKTYAGFGIIVVAALILFIILMITDRRKDKHQ
jgi:hypothetical protein